MHSAHAVPAAIHFSFSNIVPKRKASALRTEACFYVSKTRSKICFHIFKLKTSDGLPSPRTLKPITNPKMPAKNKLNTMTSHLVTCIKPLELFCFLFRGFFFPGCVVCVTSACVLVRFSISYTPLFLNTFLRAILSNFSLLTNL